MWGEFNISKQFWFVNVLQLSQLIPSYDKAIVDQKKNQS